MKKVVLLLRFAMIIGCGILASACAKESDVAAPQLRVKPQTFNAEAFTPGYLNPLQIGKTWMQGPAATGLTDYIEMTFTSQKITPKGEIDTWVQTNPVPEAFRPTTKLIWNKSYTHVIDGISYTYQIHCTTQTDGTMFMRTNWNLSTNRSDDL